MHSTVTSTKHGACSGERRRHRKRTTEGGCLQARSGTLVKASHKDHLCPPLLPIRARCCQLTRSPAYPWHASGAYLKKRQDLPGSRSDSITRSKRLFPAPTAQWCALRLTAGFFLPLHTQGRVLAKRAPLDEGGLFVPLLAHFSTSCKTGEFVSEAEEGGIFFDR